MATDVWALSALGSPAATDRVPFATGSNTGGYSLRGEFVWKRSGGEYISNGPLVAGFTGSDAIYNAGWYGRSPSGGTIDWDFKTNDATYGARTAFTVTAAGNIGIGTTAPAFRLQVKSSSEIARFETTTVRGSGNGYIGFADPTGRKGYVGYGGGNDDMQIANELSGALQFVTANAFRWVIAAGGIFYPVSDNTFAIGSASNRVSVYWGATGTINTSDEREKTWRGAPTASELAAARRIAAELGFYQWNDAIAEKGADGARLHFGVRAQAVWKIMADEGLIDPITEGVIPTSSYAFLCYDEWESIDAVEAVEEIRNEEGVIVTPASAAIEARPAGNRFGLRVDQLALFLIAAQQATILSLEDRLSVLEGV